MNGVCVFCGFTGKLTAEHVLPEWLKTIGLPLEAMRHEAGPMNRTGRKMGVSVPFTRTVSDVCGRCNGGWMSALESGVKDTLAPLIRGERGPVPAGVQAIIAAWTQKTALVGMLVNARIEREGKRQVPADEYRLFFENRAAQAPLPSTQFWLGRYDGSRRTGSIFAVPLIVGIDGHAPADAPQAYLMTLVVGRLLLQGVRYTSPWLDVQIRPDDRMQVIWPTTADFEWPPARGIDDKELVRTIVKGRHLRTTMPGVRLEDWKAATELPGSRAVGTMVELPTACGEHVVYYPGPLRSWAMMGDFFWFLTACECGTSYLLRTERDGTHCVGDGTAEEIAASYEALPGDELVYADENGEFFFKCVVEPLD